MRFFKGDGDRDDGKQYFFDGKSWARVIVAYRPTRKAEVSSLDAKLDLSLP